jgi:hypothetical protein
VSGGPVHFCCSHGRLVAHDAQTHFFGASLKFSLSLPHTHTPTPTSSTRTLSLSLSFSPPSFQWLLFRECFFSFFSLLLPTLCVSERVRAALRSSGGMDSVSFTSAQLTTSTSSPSVLMVSGVRRTSPNSRQQLQVLRANSHRRLSPPHELPQQHDQLTLQRQPQQPQYNQPPQRSHADLHSPLSFDLSPSPSLSLSPTASSSSPSFTPSSSSAATSSSSLMRHRSHPVSYPSQEPYTPLCAPSYEQQRSAEPPTRWQQPFSDRHQRGRNQRTHQRASLSPNHLGSASTRSGGGRGEVSSASPSVRSHSLHTSWGDDSESKSRSRGISAANSSVAESAPWSMSSMVDSLTNVDQAQVGASKSFASPGSVRNSLSSSYSDGALRRFYEEPSSVRMHL